MNKRINLSPIWGSFKQKWGGGTEGKGECSIFKLIFLMKESCQCILKAFYKIEALWLYEIVSLLRKFSFTSAWNTSPKSTSVMLFLRIYGPFCFEKNKNNSANYPKFKYFKLEADYFYIHSPHYACQWNTLRMPMTRKKKKEAIMVLNHLLATWFGLLSSPIGNSGKMWCGDGTVNNHKLGRSGH